MLRLNVQKISLQKEFVWIVKNEKICKLEGKLRWNMDWGQIFTNLIAVSVAMGGAFAWLWARLDKKFEKIDQKFEKIDQKFEKIDQNFKSIGEKFEEIRTEFKIECKQIRDEFKSELDQVKKDIMEIKISVAKLEDRTDERVFKVIHVEGTGTSK